MYTKYYSDCSVTLKYEVEGIVVHVCIISIMHHVGMLPIQCVHSMNVVIHNANNSGNKSLLRPTMNISL